MTDGQPSCNLTELVRQYYGLLYRYAYRLSGSAADAEDLTQQAFLTAQKKWDQLRDPQRAGGWLCAILRNAYRKSLRSRPTGGQLPLEKVPEPSQEPSELDVDEERLQAVLGQLPEEFRTPLILFYMDEFSYKEIAEQMEVPIGTVMSRLARAKAYLRRRLAAPATAEHARSSPRALR